MCVALCLTARLQGTRLPTVMLVVTQNRRCESAHFGPLQFVFSGDGREEALPVRTGHERVGRSRTHAFLQGPVGRVILKVDSRRAAV